MHVTLSCFVDSEIGVWSAYVKDDGLALTGVAQIVGRHRANRNVAGLIPGRGTCLGCVFGPQGSARGNRSMFLSLPFSVPSPLSRINKEKTI